MYSRSARLYRLSGGSATSRKCKLHGSWMPPPRLRVTSRQPDIKSFLRRSVLLVKLTLDLSDSNSGDASSASWETYGSSFI